MPSIKFFLYIYTLNPVENSAVHEDQVLFIGVLSLLAVEPPSSCPSWRVRHRSHSNSPGARLAIPWVQRALWWWGGSSTNKCIGAKPWSPTPALQQLWLCPLLFLPSLYLAWLHDSQGLFWWWNTQFCPPSLFFSLFLWLQMLGDRAAPCIVPTTGYPSTLFCLWVSLDEWMENANYTGQLWGARFSSIYLEEFLCKAFFPRYHFDEEIVFPFATWHWSVEVFKSKINNYSSWHDILLFFSFQWALITEKKREEKVFLAHSDSWHKTITVLASRDVGSILKYNFTYFYTLLEELPFALRSWTKNSASTRPPTEQSRYVDDVQCLHIHHPIAQEHIK